MVLKEYSYSPNSPEIFISLREPFFQRVQRQMNYGEWIAASMRMSHVSLTKMAANKRQTKPFYDDQLWRDEMIRLVLINVTIGQKSATLGCQF